MKTPMIIVFFLSVVQIVSGQSSATFTQEIHLENQSQLYVDFDVNYVIEKYDGQVLKVETNVELYNGGKETLQYLNRQGQYRLYFQKALDGVTITDNTRRQLALINGAPLCEEVTHIVYVPHDYVVQNQNDLTALVAVR